MGAVSNELAFLAAWLSGTPRALRLWMFTRGYYVKVPAVHMESGTQDFSLDICTISRKSRLCPACSKEALSTLTKFLNSKDKSQSRCQKPKSQSSKHKHSVLQGPQSPSYPPAFTVKVFLSAGIATSVLETAAKFRVLKLNYVCV